MWVGCDDFGHMDKPSHPWVTLLQENLLELKLPAEFSDEEFRGYIEAADDWYRMRKPGPVAWTLDASDLQGSNPVKRRMLVGHLQTNKEQLNRDCRGIAVVTPNKMLRGIMQAVLWFAPLAYPHGAFDTVDEARDWARRHLTGDVGMAAAPPA